MHNSRTQPLFIIVHLGGIIPSLPFEMLHDNSLFLILRIWHSREAGK
jgi:hypothetical protein